jgi:hypothetical protein
MRNISCGFVKKVKAHILHTINIFCTENHAVYEIMWKNTAEPNRPQRTAHYGAEKMRFACWITKKRIQTNIRNLEGAYTLHFLKFLLCIANKSTK